MVKATDWSNRQKKFYVRKLFYSSGNTCNEYLTLPGHLCEDIKTAFNMGRIAIDKTTITAVERTRSLFVQMERNLREIWGGQYRTYNCELAELKKLAPTDLAFLDYNGNLTTTDALWFRKSFAPALVTGAEVGITLQIATRNNHFIPQLTDMMRNEFRQIYLDMMTDIRDLQKIPKKFWEHFTTYLFLMRHYLFAEFECKIAPGYYRENKSPSSMSFWLLMNMKRVGITNQETYNRIDTLIRDNFSHRRRLRFISSDLPSLEKSRDQMLSARARKAWATRRSKQVLLKV